MLIDFASFTPLSALAGGAVIGLAAAVLLLFNGRIAGISGIVGGLLKLPKQDSAWRVAFLLGLLIAAPLAGWLGMGSLSTLSIDASWAELLCAGFIVGIGTRYASGCTSGHGVCGISRGSLRSLVATLSFMAAGFMTVFIKLHLLGA